jgi:hypothetical protein
VSRTKSEHVTSCELQFMNQPVEAPDFIGDQIERPVDGCLFEDVELDRMQIEIVNQRRINQVSMGLALHLRQSGKDPMPGPRKSNRRRQSTATRTVCHQNGHRHRALFSNSDNGLAATRLHRSQGEASFLS